MAPILHIVRHAQGLHNVFPGNDALVDPELTSTGIAQCVALRDAFPHHDQLTHLAASPMRRAIQTCLTAFGKPVLMDVLQETSDAPNDTGSSVEALRAEFGDAVDVSCVSAAWTDKGEGSFFAPEIEQVVARAAVARNALRALAGDGDGHVVCVTHGGFVHFLTDDWEGISLQRRSTWANCDYRSYGFVDGPGGEVLLRETDESWRRRRGDQPRPTAEEQGAWRREVVLDFAPHMRYRGF